VGISSAQWPLFGIVWPSGPRLAEALLRRPVTPGERILELGCGLGLAALVGHRRGDDITASDCHPLAGPFLQANALLNGLPPVAYRHATWTTADEPADADTFGATLDGRFDLILASDVLYERDETGQLSHFIDRHGATGGEVLIIDPNRGHRTAFHRRMAGFGYSLTETPLGGVDHLGAVYHGRVLHYRRQLARQWHP
jgi:predicted nicotinamide N-methyase